MRITFVLPSFPLEPVGGFKVVYEYANNFVARGHEVNIVHPAILPRKPLPKGLLKKARRLARLILNPVLPPKPPKTINWQFIDSRVSMLYVPNLNERYIPDGDAVIATAWHTADYVYIYSPNKGEKFYFIQSYEIWDGPTDRVNKTWLYPMHKIVIAKWLMEVGEKLGATGMAHIPNAIDHSKFKITRPIEGRPKRVAMLYSKALWKGSDDGIKALQIAKERVPELEAVLFGTPSRGDNIPKWIEYHQDPPQQLLVDEIYNGSSIYLCPSWVEGWHLPPAEACACGCAVVSTDIGGVRDYAIHNETALLSPPKDPFKLAENLIHLLLDDELRVRIARRGNENIKNFTYERSTDMFEQYLISNVQIK